MIIKIEFEEGDLNPLHDIIYDLFDKELPDEKLLEIWNQLPEDIHSEAIRWGTSDTVVRDSIYEHIVGSEIITEIVKKFN